MHLDGVLNGGVIALEPAADAGEAMTEGAEFPHRLVAGEDERLVPGSAEDIDGGECVFGGNGEDDTANVDGKRVVVILYVLHSVEFGAEENQLAFEQGDAAAKCRFVAEVFLSVGVRGAGDARQARCLLGLQGPPCIQRVVQRSIRHNAYGQDCCIPVSQRTNVHGGNV